MISILYLLRSGLLIMMCTAFALAQYPNVRISSPSSTNPEEVSIAINPANPLNLAAGANITYYYYSTNGGLNWTQGNLSSSYGVWGDPCVIFDHLGNLYYGHLSYPPSPGYWIDRIVVQKSTNGGATWSAGVGIGYNPPVKNQDKEWLAVDVTGSPHHGSIYMSWTEFDNYGSSSTTDSTRILFSRSTDAGATWSTPLRISDHGGDCIDEDNTVEGAVPAVGPHGEIYTAWSGPLGIMFDKSTDGGVTWGSDVFVSSQPGGWDFAVSGIYRANGLPITACDASNSPYRGTIYVCWSDQRNGLTNTDIFITRSTDGGQTWGPVRRVNDDLTTRDQFFCWMTIDQATGYLYVVFYDRRNTLGNNTDVYVARSTDGGETFANFVVSQSSFNPTSNIFFGDYTNIAALNGNVYPIWMRLDGSNLSVWTALVNDSVGSTYHIPVSAGWNMVSLPVTVSDRRTTSVFPTATSTAGTYEQGVGYVERDTLRYGEGYWLKFPSDQQVSITGLPRTRDTIEVTAGWNLIGSTTAPVMTGSIIQVPPGIVESYYYKYNQNGYFATEEIDPGIGLWVKANAPGSLIFGPAETLAPNSDPEMEYRIVHKKRH